MKDVEPEEPATLCATVDARAVRRFVGGTTDERGRAYARAGNVERIRMSDDGHVLRAEVVGSRPAPYHVTVRAVHRRGANVQLGSSCTCPIGSACKHAAAVVHAAIAAREVAWAGEEPVAQPPSPRVDPRVEQWLSRVRAARRTTTVDAASPEVLVYTLSADPWNALAVDAEVVRRRKDGTLGARRKIQLLSLVASSARYLQLDDVLAGRLLGDAGFGLPSGVRLRLREEGLDAVLRTGRAFWRDGTEPLRRGAPRAGTLAWRLDGDGSQRPHVLVEGAPAVSFVIAGPWYVDAASGEVGPLELDVDAAYAVALLGAPPLREVDAAVARAVLDELVLPAPRATLATRVVAEPPVVTLRLEGRAMRRDRFDDRGGIVPVAQLGFRYGARMYAPDEGPAEVREASADELVVRRRDVAAEVAAVDRLIGVGLQRFGGWIGERLGADGGTFAFPDAAGDEVWARFLLGAVPALRAEGWDVAIADSFPERIVVADEPWDVDVGGAGMAEHLFDVDVAVDVDGRRVPLVPLIVEALRRSPKLLAGEGAALIGRLPDGRHLAVPAERVRAVVAMLVELFDPQRGRAERVPLARAVVLAELDGALRLRGSGADRVRAAAAALAAPATPAVAVPATLHAELRPYQHDGLDWLQRLRAHGFGGILADSMGLGKTVQTLAHLLVEQEAGRLDVPALVVAPTSVLPNWQAEAARFAPSLRTLVLHGSRRAEGFGEIANADLVVTSYALLVRDEAVLAGRDWSIAILDEAQNVKNPAAKVAQIAHRLRARQRLALTGTPIENHLGELWSLFAYVDPGVLGERARFVRAFRTPIEKYDDADRRAALAARIAPFVLRRTKEAVARELPPKTEIVRPIALGTAQRDLYETVRAAMHARVRDAIAKRGLAKSHIVVLDALLKLRQICCDPRLLDRTSAHAAGSGAKLGVLLEMLPELLDDGRRILLFSQFTSMLALIEDELRAAAIPYELLTGKTRDRATPVRRFQAGEVSLFLVSLKAGGTGLNLTAADTVIHYDPWWNPAVERQATDRAHRIGQTQPVFVYKLVCEGTIEERILELHARKAALADALLDGDAAHLTLDEDELARLFA